MQNSNSDRLFNSCPLIFRGRNLGVKQNLMYFGFECSDGWFDIIYELSKKIERIAETMKADGLPEDEIPMVSQVKEKFGTLRFYMSNTTSEIQDLISQCEQSSAQACEQCGKPGTLRRTNGWFLTVCEKCEVSDDN